MEKERQKEPDFELADDQEGIPLKDVLPKAIDDAMAEDDEEL
jgi:hypothetical protein